MASPNYLGCWRTSPGRGWQPTLPTPYCWSGSTRCRRDPAPAGRVRGRGSGRGAAVRHPDFLRRAVPRSVRLSAPTRPAPARTPGGPDRRHLWRAGLRDHVPGSRAGHSAGESVVERMHQPDADRGDVHDPAVLARHYRARRDGPALCPGHPLRPRSARHTRNHPRPGKPRPCGFTVRLPIAAAVAVERMAEEGFLAGARRRRGRSRSHGGGSWWWR